MSGGHWDYLQYRFTDVAEDIEALVRNNGKEKPKEEINRYFDEDKFYPEYPQEVIEEFKKAIPIIRQAQVYMQRIDWLLSGDDGEESFIERLKEDLKDISLP